jgi:hypothetical protein
VWARTRAAGPKKNIGPHVRQLWLDGQCAGTLRPVSRSLDGFLAAAPRPQRAGLHTLLALARRPRGAKLLARIAPLEQLTCGLLAAERCEVETVARALGWDATAVVARGRALRRAEGRP